MPNNTDLLATLTARALLATRRKKDIGVIAEDLPSMDFDILADSLKQGTNKPLRLVLLGYSEAKLKSNKDVLFSSDVTEANRWRNDKEAREGMPLFILARGSVSKLKSLKSSLPVIGDRDLRHFLKDEAISWHDIPLRRALWAHLAENKVDFTLNTLLDFASSGQGVVTRSNKVDLPDYEAKALYKLGLLPYRGLRDLSGESQVSKHLDSNQALVKRLRRLTKKDLLKLTQLIAQVEETGQGESENPRVETAKRILRYSKHKQREDLNDLDFDVVSDLFKPTKPEKKKGDTSDNEPQKPIQATGDHAALLDFVESEGKNITEIANLLDKEVDDDTPRGEVSIGETQVLPRERSGTSQARTALQKLITENNFGGIIKSQSHDPIGCLKALEATEASWKPFCPRETAGASSSLYTILQTAISRLDDLSPDHIKAWEEYVEARNALLPFKNQLADHPLVALAGNPQILAKVELLIKKYGDMLTAIETVRAVIAKESAETARRLSSQALALDIIVMQFAGGTVALASPLHPFHLWRWVQIVQLVRDFRVDLKNFDETQLQQISNPVVTAPHLLVSNYLLPDSRTHLVFVGVGNLGGLPLYAEPKGKIASQLRVDGLGRVASKFINNAPYAQFGFEVVFIDPPSIADVLDAVLSINRGRKQESLIPIHLRVFRTRLAPTTTDEDDDRMEELADALHDCKGSLDVDPQNHSVTTLADLLNKRQAHYMVFFEPGEPKELRLEVNLSHRQSPILLPRQYRYDRMTEQFEVIICGDASEFGGYFALFKDLLQVLTGTVIGRCSGAQQWRKEIEELGKHAIWFSIIDQGIEPTYTINGAIALGRSMIGDRDFLTFTSHRETLDRYLEKLVKQSGLTPDTATCSRTNELIRRLGGDTLSLTIDCASLSGNLAPTHSIGLMGVLAVVKHHVDTQTDWLLVSLDTELARAWILGANIDDNRHGDLLCIRSTNSGLQLDVIEVKVRSELSSVVNIDKNKISGSAVGQIDNTISILNRILAKNPNQLDRTRKEILRDQLYMAVATQDMKPEAKWRTAKMLDEFFSNGPQKVSGKLFVVHIESGADWDHAKIGYGTSPDGNEMEVSEITLGEAETSLTATNPPSPTPISEPRTSDAKAPAQTGPTLKRKKDEAKKEKQPATPTPTDTLPDGFAFNIGVDPTEKPVTWDTRLNPAFGVLVTGDTGFGKTQTIKALIAELREQNYPVLIFDYKPDYLQEEFTRRHKLEVYNVDRDGLPFNPLALMPDDSGEVHPIQQAHELAGILGRVFNLGDQQKMQIVDAQRQAYTDYGWDPRRRVKLDPSKSAPTFDDVMAHLKKAKATYAQTAYSRLQPILDLDLFTPKRTEEPFESFLKRGIVLAMNNLDKSLANVLSEILIMKIHAMLRRGEQPMKLRRMLILDEAWRVANSTRLVELARESRAFGVGITIGTQNPKDMPETLISCLRTQLFLFNKDPENQRAIARAICNQSSGREASRIIETMRNLAQFQGLLVSEQYKDGTRVNVLPYWERFSD